MAGATPSQGVTDGPRQLIAGPTSFALSVGGRQSSIVDKWRQNFTVEVFFSDSRWSDTSIAAYDYVHRPFDRMVGHPSNSA